MKALVKDKAQIGLSFVDKEVPKIKADEVLIEIKKTAICGTDIHIWDWNLWAQKNISLPTVTGHEFLGEIVELGKEVKHLSLGQRVSGEGHLTCGLCRNCLAGRRHYCRETIGIGIQKDGAFAEYLVLPARNAYKIDDDISDDLAAIFDPFGNAVHTTLSFDLVGEDVLITGAGPIGLMATKIAKHAGARHVVVTDRNEYRLALARKMGASLAVNTTKKSLDEVMRGLKMREGFDVGLEMSGSSGAFCEMIACMNHGAKIAILGLLPETSKIDWNALIFKSLTLKGIYGRKIFDTWYKMSSLIQSGLDLSPVITHHFDAKDYKQAFEAMKTGQTGKVILNWDT